MGGRFLHCSEQEWDTDPGVVRQVLIRGSARTSGFRWKVNKQVRHSRPTLSQPHSMTDGGHHVTIDHVWGVIDTVPETNFPDIRNRCVIHSESGSCMVIPREGDKVRLYIQLSDKQVIDPVTGRVDKSRVSTEHVLQVNTLSCHYTPVLATINRSILIRRQSKRSSGLTQSTPERLSGGRFTSVCHPLRLKCPFCF